ncbi:MAG: PAS domain-containing protein [Lentisphaerae bacterium]|nr:PAS domain-containing protein [Lentisphaerota bacterium]MCP4102084.1 PAS domain-containing protein [Lentisphaerota bacterium]
MQIFFEKLEFLRKNKKISIQELCSKIGISRGTYWRCKKGVTNLSETNIFQIASELNVEVSEISDLAKRTSYTGSQISAAAEIWNNLATENIKMYDKHISEIINELKSLNTSLKNKMLFISGLMNTSDIAFYAKDFRQKYVIANLAFLNNLSLSSDYTIFNKTDDAFFNRTESRYNTEQDRKVINTRQPIISVEQYIPGTKKRKWGMISKIPIIDSDDKVIGLVAIMTDITEKKKVENINEIMAESINSLNASLIIQDFETKKILFANDKTIDIFGYEKEKFMSWTNEERIARTVYEKDRSIFLSESYLDKNHSEKKNFEFRVVKPDNQVRWLKVYYSFFDYFDRIWQVSIYRDVTEEKNQKEVNEILKLNIDFFSQGIAIRDFETFKTLYENDAYEQIFSYKASAIKSQNDFVNSGKWKMTDDVKTKILQAFNSKKKQTKLTYKVTTPDGKTKYILDQLYIKKIFGRLCYCLVSTDITFSMQEIKKIKYDIAMKLKNKNISNDIISEATGIDIM